jgi:hypothetical protein
MSLMQTLANALIGPAAACIVGALEYLGRRRSVCGGLVAEIVVYTHMADADINPALIMLIIHGIVRVKGVAIVELVEFHPCEVSRALAGQAIEARAIEAPPTNAADT